MQKILASVKRLIAVCVLFLIYETAWLVSRLRSMLPRKTQARTRRILLIGTFDNANWFHAHVEPIVRSGHSEVILVCDEPVADVSGVTFCCPSPWAARLLPRAVAKFIWSIVAMRRHRPDLCMGYHVFPAGVIALIVGRLFGRPAAFQVTSGQLELEGGGWHAENKLLIALGRPSAIVERSVLRMLREFELLVVRGSRAKNYVEQAGFAGLVVTITGSVVMADSRPALEDRPVDILFIGRLTEYKRPDRFLEVVTLLSKSRPGINAVVLGDGPDAGELQAESVRRGIDRHIRWNGKTANVADFQLTSKIQLLTSRWEGVSIAMLESMGSGCVPVVSDVGDLRDFVIDDETGYVVPEDDIESYAQRIGQLLDDTELWDRLSRNARNEIEQRSSKRAIAESWRQTLDALLDA